MSFSTETNNSSVFEEHKDQAHAEEKKAQAILNKELDDARREAKKCERETLQNAKTVTDELDKIYAIAAFMMGTSDDPPVISESISDTTSLSSSEMAEISRSVINLADEEGITKMLDIIEMAKTAVMASFDAVNLSLVVLDLVNNATDAGRAKSGVERMREIRRESWGAVCAIKKAVIDAKADVNGKVLTREPVCSGYCGNGIITFVGFNLDPFVLFETVKEVLDEVIATLPLQLLVEEKKRWEDIIRDEPDSEYTEFRKELLRVATDKLEAGSVPLRPQYREINEEYSFCYSLSPTETIDDEEEFEGTLYSTPSPHHYRLGLRCIHRPFNGRWGEFQQIREKFVTHPKIKAFIYPKIDICRGSVKMAEMG